MKKKLKPAQERFWRRLTGQHNHRIRQQMEYMLRSGSLTPREYDCLVERSYTCSESEIWRLIIDHIRVNTMRDFDLSYNRPARRRSKRPRKR